MKKYFLLIALIFVGRQLSAQQPINRDSADIKRLVAEARKLMGAADNASALPKVDSLLPIMLRSVGKGTVDYAMYLHLKGTLELNFGRPVGSLNLLKEAFNLRRQLLGDKDADTQKTRNNLANAYFELGEIAQSFNLHRENLGIRKAVEPENSMNVAISYLNVANLLHTSAAFDSAIVYNTMGVGILKALAKTEPDNAQIQMLLANAYYNLGNDYYSSGKVQKAIDYARQSLAIRELVFGEDEPEVAFSYYGLGNMYIGSGDFKKGIDYQLIALNIRLEKLGARHPLVGSSYNNLGSAYGLANMQDSAVYYHQKSLDTYLSGDEPSDPDISFAESSLGLALFQAKKLEAALPHIQKGLEMRKKIYGPQHYLVARSLNSLAAWHLKKYNFEKALESVQQAEDANRYNGRDFEGVIAMSELLESFSLRGEIERYIFDARKDQNALERALVAFRNARAAFDFTRLDFTPEGSDYALDEDQIRQTGERLILTCYTLWKQSGDQKYLQEAFNYTEKAKSWTLFKSLKADKALHFAGLPDSIVEQERAIRTAIGLLEKKVFDEEFYGEEADFARIGAYNEPLLEKKKMLETLKNQIQQAYPNYYKIKYDQQVETIEDIQKNLIRPHQTLLAYHVGESFVFVFLIKKDLVTMDTLHIDSLGTYIQQIRSFLEKSFDDSGRKIPSQYNKRAPEYTRAAYALAQELVFHFKDVKIDTDLVLIPSGILGYLPFDLLLRSKPANPSAFYTHDYLLKSHCISYHYSATLWREMTDAPLPSNMASAFRGFAPFSQGKPDPNSMKKGDDRLNPLKYSSEEVDAAKSSFGGLSFIGPEATKQKLLEEAGKASILHLSTHGIVQDSNSLYASYLALYPGKNAPADENRLYLREIYNIPLSGTEMVVLSACRTARGELRQSEGIISLARAFAYAGARSIIPTLWSVEEKSTKEIIVDFYKYLAAGQPKDHALWKAKRDYLSRLQAQPGADTYAHPFWWAGIIAVGNMRSVK
jgi:CHAT domain-containing protein